MVTTINQIRCLFSNTQTPDSVITLLNSQQDTGEPLDSAYCSLLPVWISFARLSSTIGNDHNLSLDDFFRNWLHQHSYDEVIPLFDRALKGGQVILLLDGLDEATSESTGSDSLSRAITFATSKHAKAICTSRPHGFSTLGVLGSWLRGTLTPFDDKKIEKFAENWFRIAETSSTRSQDNNELSQVSLEAKSRANAFFLAASDNYKTLQLARNPLICQALIELYRYSHRLPEARVAAYTQIVELFLSRHPASRAQAGGVSQPDQQLGLRNNELKDILIRLAWSIQTSYNRTFTSKSICSEVCSKFLEDQTFGLGMNRTKAKRMGLDVIEYLMKQYGVLVERSPEEISFVHLSIQEYLSAEWVARQEEETLINWLSSTWLLQEWRECIVSWFGVLDTRGARPLAARACQVLVQLGKTGEWQRIQSLELRIELATSDLGLPISEARTIVCEATQEMENSPFHELRATLARRLTIGALGSPIRAECIAAIEKLGATHSVYHRRSLLSSFNRWAPTTQLRTTLLRAMQDADSMCRRFAATTFSQLFFEETATLETLLDLASHHISPEVREAAIHGLSTHVEWGNEAIEMATRNMSSSNHGLLVACIQSYVSCGKQTEKQLHQIIEIHQTDTIDYWYKPDLVKLLVEGWPNQPKLRDHFLAALRDQNTSFWDLELQFEYLVRYYPQDEEVASMIASQTPSFRYHLHDTTGEIWHALRRGFRGNPIVVAALREMLNDQREKYEAIFWHPSTLPAFGVIGDDKARDELLKAYKHTEFRDRYWIAKTLYDAWGDDQIVSDHFSQLSMQSANVAAPLITWREKLYPERSQRRDWLLRLESELVEKKETDIITVLLKEFPSEEIKNLALPYFDSSAIWYYNKVSLQGLYAKTFPNDSKSLGILSFSLSEIDGPDPGSFSESFGNISDAATRLLSAAISNPPEVHLYG